ncbi:MAG TPA: hypothetical protein VJP77_02515, partial [Planctomycetota bacterium]|nr:hypothetical protein [Planctomycetota bacterium]
AAAPEELEYAEFQAQYRKAAEIVALDQMSRLIRQNPNNAVSWVVTTAELLADNPSEQAGKDMTALKRGWKEAQGTEFPARMERYFSLLSPELKRTRRTELRPAWDRLLADWQRIEKEPRSPQRDAFAGQAGDDLLKLGEAFEKVGDAYFASQAYMVGAIAWDEPSLGEASDPVKVLAGYRKAVALRESVDLKDVYYAQSKNRLESLEALYGAAESGPALDPAEVAKRIPGVELGGPPLSLTATFQAVPSPAPFERPGWSADEAYPSWEPLFLQAEGSIFRFDRMGDASPRVVRKAASQVVFESADGTEVEIPLTGRNELIEVVLPPRENAPERRWGLVVRQPADKEYYHDIEVNYAANTDNMTLFMTPGAAMAYSVGETPVLVLDDNLDGLYGSAPYSYTALGVAEGEYQPEFDSVVVGGAKRAVPFSKFLKIGAQWFQWESLDGGTRLELVPATVQTGRLKLRYKGPKLAWLVVAGVGRLEGTYFDLLSDKDGVEVPIGQYALLGGGVREGKRLDVQKAVILPGKDTPRWSVEAGQVAEVALGEPFGFDFAFEPSPDNVVLKGGSVTVTGVAGERYHRLWNATVRPEASVREAGGKKSTKPEELERVLTQDELYDGRFVTVWHPKDATLPHPFGTEAVEVQLVQKKHDLFGKLESAWLGPK